MPCRRQISHRSLREKEERVTCDKPPRCMQRRINPNNAVEIINVGLSLENTLLTLLQLECSDPASSFALRGKYQASAS